MAVFPNELAPYAADASAARGRLIAEPASPTRTEFQRDRDRIIHTTAFRRLAHKTQVFVAEEGDHFRTRLTHTIEVAQISRALARSLQLDGDLAEALALAHDLGHTCFGHTGEDALQECMADYGGFDHNAQALRIVIDLERRYAAFDGLNLTWETLEGLVKHNGPLLTAGGTPTERYRTRGVPEPILAYDRVRQLDLATYASAEAQAAAIADDIAYNTHDLDDGLRAGLFRLADLKEVPYLAALLAEIEALHPGLLELRVVNELQRRLITRFVEDVIRTTQEKLAKLAPESVEAIRHAGETMVTFSPAMAATERSIKTFLFARMYRNPEVMRVRAKADQIVRDLFRLFQKHPEKMPGEWRRQALNQSEERRRARTIADYIAGMTDRYALAEHKKLIGDIEDLR
ncbi:deoxyguanosinetriphosphate triphosphohydrolase [Methylovirgula sp. 4M-Z18]|uniref:deoxyguanosinetriphosphate triphosphohydrolase n=1 Tax=Methylovirgula sp. 4M-Z18 TaxID=2293567 RepID=UPI000E2E997E|nr:deoxyguanosinetriphosphate triphosphohydrolase [Methylovirgula sp. 4M-Z18]RFB81572.1 deoxyguanosinetriphosphate triphosphohydrolase [Methylovirgula sp. 4M-Z18]